MKRAKKYNRNTDLENLLQEINHYFGIIEQQKAKDFTAPKHPVVFIMGSPRSGTTLISQILAASGKFGYPSNFISRFYNAPYWGVKIQNLLVDERYNYNDELSDLKRDPGFNSYLGKTKGIMAPNEFWYFWRRFFTFSEDSNKLSTSDLKKVDHGTFLRELAAMEDAFGKPLCMKGMILNWNIEYLYEIFMGKVIFIYTERQMEFNIQSLLNARKSFWDDEKQWYSFKPPEYNQLKDLPPEEQAAGQIYFTNKSIKESLGKLSTQNSIFVNYEDFIDSPETKLSELESKIQLFDNSFHFDKKHLSFDNTNAITSSKNKWTQILKATEKYKQS